MTWQSSLKGRIFALILSPFFREVIATVLQVVQRVLIGSNLPHVFIQVDDPYSYLLLQVLQSTREKTKLLNHVNGTVVGAPLSDVNPEPDMNKQYAVRDARMYAAFLGLTFPDEVVEANSALQESILHRAQEILLGTKQKDFVRVALSCCRAYWFCEEDRLDALEHLSSNSINSSESNNLERQLVLNGQLQRKLFHYRGGTLLYKGQWMWGVDRLRYIDSRLEISPSSSSLLWTKFITGKEADRLAAAASSKKVEMFFSFRSPYSYIALERTKHICDQAGVSLELRPVFPMVSRGYPVPLMKKVFLVSDVKRDADYFGIPFGTFCDPLPNGGIERCFSLFPFADSKGLMYEYCLSVAQGIWSEAADVRNDNDLQRLVERAGLIWNEASSHLGSSEYVEKVENNRISMMQIGVWGVPSFRTGSIVLWGQDRLPMLESYLLSCRD